MGGTRKCQTGEGQTAAGIRERGEKTGISLQTQEKAFYYLFIYIYFFARALKVCLQWEEIKGCLRFCKIKRASCLIGD